MTEIFSYLNGRSRRRITVGYRKENGKMQRIFRKIEGNDHEQISKAVEQIKGMGYKPVLEIYRPNGSAEIQEKTFTIGEDGHLEVSEMPLFKKSDESGQKQQPRMPNPTDNKSNDWKDYALSQETAKVKKLEQELARVMGERNTLEAKVHEFEKEMIKKDFELEKKEAAIASKSQLGEVVGEVSKNPQAMNLLTGLASRLLGIPIDQTPGAQQIGTTEGSGNPQTDQYVANIKLWLGKQTPELQEAFYNMVFHLTNNANVPSTVNTMINFLTKGSAMGTGTNG